MRVCVRERREGGLATPLYPERPLYPKALPAHVTPIFRLTTLCTLWPPFP